MSTFCRVGNNFAVHGGDGCSCLLGNDAVLGNRCSSVSTNDLDDTPTLPRNISSFGIAPRKARTFKSSDQRRRKVLQAMAHERIVAPVEASISIYHTRALLGTRLLSSVALRRWCIVFTINDFYGCGTPVRGLDVAYKSPC